MKKIFPVIILVLLFITPACNAGFLDNIINELSFSPEKGLDENTVISGLKEALSVGTENAVKDVSRVDGYMANQAIRILMPEKIRNAAEVLKKVGYQKQVDEFIASMNHAAENAASRATPHFISAIKDMTFTDARNILDGSDTAATDYFRSKTFDNLYSEFKPVISSSMDQVGTTRKYREMMGKYASLPFVNEIMFDLDHYVTSEALNGLFHVVAEEEKKIRTDPAARVSDLLRKVFQK